MKTKEEIRHYLDTRFSASEDDMVQIVRNDFETGENRLFNSVADRDIGRVNLQDLPKTYWQVAIFRPDRRCCDAITVDINMGVIC